MISVIIPAFNESASIARTLSAMLTGASASELEIIVVCNGCTDATAEIARGFGTPVQVIETPVAGKTNALNLGDQAARGFPRLYVDADVIVPMEVISTLASRIEHGNVLAAAITGRWDTTHCSWAVRAYYDIRSRLPSAREGIGGSGVYALSREGRRRFGAFPSVTADDAFVRGHFAPHERQTFQDLFSTVFAPRSLRSLIAVRARIYYGVMELAALHPGLSKGGRSPNRAALTRLAAAVRLWPGLAIYGGVCVAARLRARARRRTGTAAWARDETSRAVAV